VKLEATLATPTINHKFYQEIIVVNILDGQVAMLNLEIKNTINTMNNERQPSVNYTRPIDCASCYCQSLCKVAARHIDIVAASQQTEHATALAFILNSTTRPDLDSFFYQKLCELADEVSKYHPRTPPIGYPSPKSDRRKIMAHLSDDIQNSNLYKKFSGR